MGAIAEAFAAFAQPLIDQTDGSMEEVNKALAMSQLCYNLALLPEQSRAEMLSEMQSRLDMEDKEFDEFRRSVILPMIRRHEAMFPRMQNVLSSSSALGTSARSGRRGEAYPGTDRYAPCPCNSGRKYKFCCGKKGL
jgi:uncharacterized protein YecA (UPF0149 family)